MRAFPAIHLEGSLFTADLLERLLSGDLPGQKPADFGLKGRSLNEEIAAVWEDLRELWQIFRRRFAQLSEKESATSLTRELWMVPFFRLLGYELHFNRKAHVVDGQTFFISHRAGEEEAAPPVHIVGFHQELGRVPRSGRPRLSPHALVQEFLNRSEALWGLVTNGRLLRLLRNTTAIRRQSYLEFDLEAIFEQKLFEDFALLYRLLHRSRLPRSGEDAGQCLLERYYQESLEQGGRVRDRLRDGVEEAVRTLGNALLAHPKNDELRRKLREGRLTAADFYDQLLRLIYRFLFLLVAEERKLIGQDPIYLEHYGIGRLRRLVDTATARESDACDLWHGLRALWLLLRRGQPVQQLGGRPLASLLGLPVLNGELFEPIDLEGCRITNRDLLAAVRHLAYFEADGARRRVNYAYLDTEELGSVYESLLDYRPDIDLERTPPTFSLRYGSERKSTGAYYTPPELVGELIGSALDPVIEARLQSASTPEEKERALLSIRVCDPACGSGHFLLAAARRIGKALAQVRTGEEEPAPEALREAVRDVIAHCLYGVDKNPRAVELCKVALWIESCAPGKPLTFLDHRIKCGDSLIGVFDLQVLRGGVPDEAFAPRTGDDKVLAQLLRGANREARRPLASRSDLFALERLLQNLVSRERRIEEIAEDTVAARREKRALYEELLRSPDRERLRELCDLWTAAFFQRFDPSRSLREFITSLTLSEALADQAPPQLLALAEELAGRHRFFHWPLEFPEVFADGGFDVVLGNPPWEQIQFEEKQFFATRDPEIAGAPNAAARKRLIRELQETNPDLWQEYQEALHAAESASRFLRGSGFYPLTGRGRINTYSVFAERMRALLRPGGRAGVIVPTGIATDDTNKRFFADLVDSGNLVSFYDFDNRSKLFPAVISLMKFCLLTIENARSKERKVSFAFFCHRTEDLRDRRKLLYLRAEDIARINPNTRTLPIFRTRQDAELTRAIYERVPVLVNERTGENPWGVTFRQGLFNMSSDSHLFRTAAELEAAGYRRVGNRFVSGGELWLPLYEAKMIWHFDHRFGTYEGAGRRTSQLPTPDETAHANPAYLVQPWYWVPAWEVEARLGAWERGWLIGFRDIARSTDERTAIFSLLPRVGVGHTMPLLLAEVANALQALTLVVNLNSLVFDWVLRQKMGGTHLTFFILRQLPILPPSAYTPEDLLFIVPRVLELTYTAWDMKPFADDVWREADEALRAAIRKQWEENREATGGHTWKIPDWAWGYPEIAWSPEEGIPFPPFKWDEERRAVLRAELDAYYARLYGLSRKQLRYILDPADLTERELEEILDPWEEVADPLDPEGYAARIKASDFPGETFRVLKEKELREFGEFRTRRLVLEAWGRYAFA